MLIHERYEKIHKISVEIFKSSIALIAIEKSGKLPPIFPIFLINVNRSAHSTGDTSLIWKMHSLIFHSILPRMKVKQILWLPSQTWYKNNTISTIRMLYSCCSLELLKNPYSFKKSEIIEFKLKLSKQLS